jgi:carbon monoxide dehydrogenase subunit G
MQLEHSFTVPVGVEDAWKVLLDIEQVAPCMPGAALETVEGDDFTGSVKVKLGPIALTYKGKASFIEKDPVAHRAVIDAQGKDARGNGTAAAKVTATLNSESDSVTRVDVITDLNITGKPAQFGRGVMADVGNKLIGQFADCLAGKLAAGDLEPAVAPQDELDVNATPSAGAHDVTPGHIDAPAEPDMTADVAGAAVGAPKPAAPAAARTIPVKEVEPIDLMASAGPAVLKRLAPLAGAGIIAILLFVILRRRRG